MLIQQNKFYWISDRSMVAHLNYTDTQAPHAKICPELTEISWMSVGASVFAQILLGNFSFLSNRDPENKHGVLGRDKIKTTKMKEIQLKWTKRWWRPWRMNFKLNECQHSNCFKTKVQLNKCEIHMDVKFTFHSPEGATVIFGLVFLGNRTVYRQSNSQSKVNSRTGELVD